MKNNQKGFIVPAFGILITVLLIGGGAYAYMRTKQINKIETAPSPMGATSTELVANQATPTSQMSGAKLLDMRTVKVGDTWGNLVVDNSSISLYPDGSPKSVHIGFIGNMIVKGTIGMNDMTGALMLSAEKEEGVQIPKFKGEDFSSTFCLTGDTSRIGVPLGSLREVTVEVKDYSIYIEGKGGCSSRAELVRVINASSINQHTENWNIYKNTARKFEIKYPANFAAREIYTHDVVVCFDNNDKPFAACVDDESNFNQVVNNEDLFRELKLEALEKKLNTAIKVEFNGGVYYIHVNNVIIRSSDKDLLQGMLSTLQIFGYNQGISK